MHEMFDIECLSESICVEIRMARGKYLNRKYHINALFRRAGISLLVIEPNVITGAPGIEQYFSRLESPDYRFTYKEGDSRIGS